MRNPTKTHLLTIAESRLHLLANRGPMQMIKPLHQTNLRREMEARGDRGKELGENWHGRPGRGAQREKYEGGRRSDGLTAYESLDRHVLGFKLCPIRCGD